MRPSIQVALGPIAKASEVKCVLLGHTDWILDLAFTPDGNELIPANRDGTVRHWRLP